MTKICVSYFIYNHINLSDLIHSLEKTYKIVSCKKYEYLGKQLFFFQSSFFGKKMRVSDVLNICLEHGHVLNVRKYYATDNAIKYGTLVDTIVNNSRVLRLLPDNNNIKIHSRRRAYD